ncbi:uncharacterized protein AB9W97_010581 [Spinachia spinachia]
MPDGSIGPHGRGGGKRLSVVGPGQAESGRRNVVGPGDRYSRGHGSSWDRDRRSRGHEVSWDRDRQNRGHGSSWDWDSQRMWIVTGADLCCHPAQNTVRCGSTESWGHCCPARKAVCCDTAGTEGRLDPACCSSAATGGCCGSAGKATVGDKVIPAYRQKLKLWKPVLKEFKKWTGNQHHHLVSAAG